MDTEEPVLVYFIHEKQILLGEDNRKTILYLPPPNLNPAIILLSEFSYTS